MPTHRLNSLHYLFSAFGFLASLAGCVEEVPRTEAIVRISTEDAVRSRMRFLEVEVWQQLEAGCAEERCWDLKVDQPFPRDALDDNGSTALTVVPPEGSNRTFEVVARALDDGSNTLVEQRAVSNFSTRSTVTVPLVLTDFCYGVGSECFASEDCRGPTCDLCFADTMECGPAGFIDQTHADAGAERAPGRPISVGETGDGDAGRDSGRDATPEEGGLPTRDGGGDASPPPECTVDGDCNDGVECTDDRCDQGTCVAPTNHALCDDGRFCNGAESCTATGCESGTPPDPADSIDCTVDECDEDADGFTHEPRDSNCPAQAPVCGPGGCQQGRACNTPADCDDGVFCNGAEECVGQVCRPGMPPTCSDGVACTADRCDTEQDGCVHDLDDSSCSNGLFCDGVERCTDEGCAPGSAPPLSDGVDCTEDRCDEANDEVVHVVQHAACDNGLFCDGSERCSEEGCVAGTPPTLSDGVGCTQDTCNESEDRVDHAPDDDECNDGLFCNGVETCDPTFGCESGTAPSCAPTLPLCVTSSCNPLDNACREVTRQQTVTYARRRNGGPITTQKTLMMTCSSAQEAEEFRITIYPVGGTGPATAICETTATGATRVRVGSDRVSDPSTASSCAVLVFSPFGDNSDSDEVTCCPEGLFP